MAGAVFAVAVLSLGQPRLSNDSYQYMSVADNVSAGQGIATNLVHFDVERAHGRVPAPLTTFAPGFPVAVAGLHGLGVPTLIAGAILASSAAALTVALLGLACASLGLSVWVARCTLLAFAANANTLNYAGTFSSEALFTLFVVATMLCLLRSELVPDPGRARMLSIAASICAGCAYVVRYAGLLVIVGMAVALGLLFLIRRSWRSFQTLVLSLVPAATIVGVVFIRNIHLTGSWKGGNAKVVHHAFLGVAHDTATAFAHLFLGPGVSPLARSAQAMVLLGVGLMLVAWRGRLRSGRSQGLLIVGVTLFVYLASMFYLGLTSVISYDTRMFFPILPLVLLLLAAVVEPGRRTRAAQVIAAATATAYLACGLFGLAAVKHNSTQTKLEADWRLPASAVFHATAFAKTVEPASLSDWLAEHSAPGEPLLASDGQLTGHVLHRPVVSLIESEYSDAVWDEREVGRTMDRFHAHYLVLYKHPVSGGAAAVQRDSPFLAGLVSGGSTARLIPVVGNSEVVVLERRSQSEMSADAASAGTALP